MEGDREQALLAAGGELGVRNVEEDGRLTGGEVEAVDPAAVLLDDVEEARIAGRRDRGDGAGETGADALGEDRAGFRRLVRRLVAVDDVVAAAAVDGVGTGGSDEDVGSIGGGHRALLGTGSAAAESALARSLPRGRTGPAAARSIFRGSPNPGTTRPGQIAADSMRMRDVGRPRRGGRPGTSGGGGEAVADGAIAQRLGEMDAADDRRRRRGRRGCGRP